MSLSVVIVKVSIAPDLTELLKSLLAHQHNDNLAFLQLNILEELLVNFIDEHFFVDIVLCLFSLTLSSLKHFVLERVGVLRSICTLILVDLCKSFFQLGKVEIQAFCYFGNFSILLILRRLLDRILEVENGPSASVHNFLRCRSWLLDLADILHLFFV